MAIKQPAKLGELHDTLAYERRMLFCCVQFHFYLIECHLCKQKKSVGIRGMTSSTPFLVLMMICCKKFLRSTSGTNKLKSILNRMSTKFHSKLGDFLKI